jgi:starvation-inducible DNA-binding protein
VDTNPRRGFDQADFVTPHDMLAELHGDNKQFAARMREALNVYAEHGDVASAGLLENFIDQAERRAWFLFQVTRHGGPSGY